MNISPQEQLLTALNRGVRSDDMIQHGTVVQVIPALLQHFLPGYQGETTRANGPELGDVYVCILNDPAKVQFNQRQIATYARTNAQMFGFVQAMGGSLVDKEAILAGSQIMGFLTDYTSCEVIFNPLTLETAFPGYGTAVYRPHPLDGEALQRKENFRQEVLESMNYLLSKGIRSRAELDQILKIVRERKGIRIAIDKSIRKNPAYQILPDEDDREDAWIIRNVTPGQIGLHVSQIIGIAAYTEVEREECLALLKM